jgi:von Willebrand factor type A domain
MAAAIEAGSLSNKDLVIATPTLEDLGLLQVQEVRDRWQVALRASEDQRAANIARNVKSKDTKEVLQVAADVAVQKAVAEVMKGLRIYILVDISGSMTVSIEVAKQYIGKFLQAFPLDQVHVSVFNTVGREIKLKAASQAAVDQAFRGIVASGGTSHGAGVKSLEKYQPKPDEDVLMIFVGDEEDTSFEMQVQASGLRPMAFGFLRTPGPDTRRAVRDTAARLRIPCFMLDTETFEDAYAVPQKLRALIASTPVGITNVPQQVARRVSLVDQILATKLLEKPAWAA